MGSNGFGAVDGASSWDPAGSGAVHGASSWDPAGWRRSLLGVRRNSWVPDPLFDGLPGVSRGRGGFSGVRARESVVGRRASLPGWLSPRTLSSRSLSPKLLARTPVAETAVVDTA